MYYKSNRNDTMKAKQDLRRTENRIKKKKNEEKNGIEIGFIGVSAVSNPKIIIESMC